MRKAGLSDEADPENNLGGSSETMYYIGLDVHKKTISDCVKDAAGCVLQEGKINSTRRELDAWIRTLPQPRMFYMLIIPNRHLKAFCRSLGALLLYGDRVDRA